MRVWERGSYKIVEVEFDHDLHQFNVVKNDEVIASIVPADLENQEQIIIDLNAGEDVDGWDDGMGGTISV